MPDVRDYEPHLALDGGADGLDPYRHLAAAVREGRLSLSGPDALLLTEVGFGQAEDVAALFVDGAGMCLRGVHRDLGGVDRVVAVSPER